MNDAEFYRRSVEDLIVAQSREFIDVEIDGSEGICPIDKEPCGFVSSCEKGAKRLEQRFRMTYGYRKKYMQVSP